MERQQQASATSLSSLVSSSSKPSSTGPPLTSSVGSAVNAVSFSPNYQQIVVAGREVLKIVDAKTFEEVMPIRVGKVNLNYSSNDVKWNPFEQQKHWLASAATNGMVVIWNLENKGKKIERVIQDHGRTVNRVCWNPTDPFGLLSGSQDGTMRLWDMRESDGKSIVFNAKSEVRDVQFSPFQSFVIAAGLESGAVQLWDTRKASAPIQTVNLHNGLVLAIAWHPTDKFMLATGGRDRIIQLWDIRNKAPAHCVQTISSVGRITWRSPAHGARASTHIISSASLMDNSIHMWDYRKPYVPLATLQGARDVVTGHLWCPISQHVNGLISCSKDGYLRLHDLDRHAYIPARHISATALSWSIQQQLTVVKFPFNRSDASSAVDSTLIPSNSYNPYDSFGPSHPLPPPPPPPPPPANGATGQTMTPPLSSSPSFNISSTPPVMSALSSGAIGTGGSNSMYSSISGSSNALTASSNPSLTGSSSNFNSLTSSAMAALANNNPEPVALTPFTVTATPIRYPWSGNALVFSPETDTKEIHTPPSTMAATTATPHRHASVGVSSFAETGFDPATFRFLAENYVLSGSISHICESNAKVAKEAQRHDVAQTWLMLHAMSNDQFGVDVGATRDMQALVESNCAPMFPTTGTPSLAASEHRLRQLALSFQFDEDLFKYLEHLSRDSHVPTTTTRDFRAPLSESALTVDDALLLAKLGVLNNNTGANGSSDDESAIFDAQYWRDLDEAKSTIQRDILTTGASGNTAMSGYTYSDSDDDDDPSRAMTSHIHDLHDDMRTEFGYAEDDSEMLGADDEAVVSRILRQANQAPHLLPHNMSSCASSNVGELGSNNKLGGSWPTPRRPSLGALGKDNGRSDEWDITSILHSHGSSSSDLIGSGRGGLNSSFLHNNNIYPSSGNALLGTNIDLSLLTAASSEPAIALASSSVDAGSLSLGGRTALGPVIDGGGVPEFLEDIEPIAAVPASMAPLGFGIDDDSSHAFRPSEGASSFNDYVQHAIYKASTRSEDMLSTHLVSVWARLVGALLSYYETLGDVQTCAHISLVIHRFHPLPNKQIMGWFLAYVDLLHRLKLWRSANAIITHCPVESIREMNKKSTSYATNCAICRKAIFSSTGVTCERCKRPTGNCSICSQPVKGTYAWCQGCGHGGHLEHLRAWFATEMACPSGCGHLCTFRTFPTAAAAAASLSTGAGVSSSSSMTGSHSAATGSSHASNGSGGSSSSGSSALSRSTYKISATATVHYG